MPGPAPGDQPAGPGLGVAPLPPVVPGLVLNPGPGPRVRTAPGHRFSPPGPRTKEKKTRVPYGGAVRIVRGLVGGLTEGLDWVDAVYSGLPERLRRREAAKRRGKDPNPRRKAQLIYDNIDQLDLTQVFLEVWKQQIEDSIYGKIGKVQGEAVGRSQTRLGSLPGL